MIRRVLVIVLIVALAEACSGSSHSASPVPPTSTRSTDTTAVTQPKRPTTPSTTVRGPIRCGGGFDAMAVSFVDSMHGWAVGAGLAPHAVAEACDTAQVSADAGRSWQGRRRIPVRVSAVIASTANEAWVWGPNLAHTVDGGAHWAVVDRNATTAGLAVDGPSIWWLYRCGQPTGVAMRTCLARSVDDGAHWQRAALPMRDLPNGPDVALLAAQFVRAGASNGWLLLEDRTYGWQFWRTTDGGTTWQQQPEPCNTRNPPRAEGWGGGIPDEPRGPLTAVDAQHLFLICTGGAGGGWTDKDVLASFDGGASWTWTGGNPSQFGGAVSMATPDAHTIIWSGGRTALNASFDGGRTWSVPTSTEPKVAFNPDDGGLHSIVFISPEDGWAIGQTPSGGSALWRTFDGGHIWTPTLL